MGLSKAMVGRDGRPPRACHLAVRDRSSAARKDIRGFWPRSGLGLSVTTNYIALAFIDDFKNFRVNDFYGDIAYLPFAVLAIGGLILTLVAWAQSLGYISRKTRIRSQST